MPLYIFGSNMASQLAQSFDTDKSTKPIAHPINSKIIACGTMHTIMKGKQLITFGNNDEGALGRTDDESELLPVKFNQNLNIKNLTAGSSHSCILTTKGSLYCCGTFRGMSGVIGFSRNVRVQKHFRCLSVNVAHIASAYNVVVFVMKNGCIKEYGARLFYPRINPFAKDTKNSTEFKDTNSQNDDIKIQNPNHESTSHIKTLNNPQFSDADHHNAESHAIGASDFLHDGSQGQNHATQNSDSQVSEVPNTSESEKISAEIKSSRDFLGPRIVVPPSNLFRNIAHITCGGNHVLIVLKTGQVHAYGNNNCGQLGIGTKTSTYHPSVVQLEVPVVKVAAGMTHSLFLTKNNQLFGCGENEYGQLGNIKRTSVPVKIMDDVLDIAACGLLSVIVKRDGVYCAGSNFYGECGVSTVVECVKVFTKVDFDFKDILGVHCGDFHVVVHTQG